MRNQKEERRRLPDYMMSTEEPRLPLLPQHNPKSIWLRFGLPVTVLCITYVSYHTTSTIPHADLSLSASASSTHSFDDIASGYALLQQLTNRSRAASVACNGVEHALCDSAVCQIIPGTNLSWCNCEVVPGAAHLGIIMDSAYLLWSPVYRDIIIALAANAFDVANDIFCTAIRSGPFWIGSASANLADTAPLLSMSGLSPENDTEYRSQHMKPGCRVKVTQCMGAPCYRRDAHSSTATCVCPLKEVDVPVVAIDQLVAQESLDVACNDPAVCAVHSRSYPKDGDVPSEFATFDMIFKLHDDLMRLDFQSDPFQSEVCDW